MLQLNLVSAQRYNNVRYAKAKQHNSIYRNMHYLITFLYDKSVIKKKPWQVVDEVFLN